MKNNFFSLLPSRAATLSLLALPSLLTFYFVATQYSQNFIVEQEITYFEVQSNWLGQLVLDQQYLEWFNRFMDFAFWGMLALVVLIIAWAFGSSRTSLQNHYAQERFQNFHESKVHWHEHFFVVLFLKSILVVLIVYSFFAIIGKYIPQLSANISTLLASPVTHNYMSVALTFCVLFVYQYVIAASIKLFKHMKAE